MYYVYIYKDANEEPFYVGKGSGNRAWHPHQFVDVPPHCQVVLTHCMNEEDAYTLERFLIDHFGGKLENRMGPDMYKRRIKHKLAKARQSNDSVHHPLLQSLTTKMRDAS